jgi:hypothetical protein
MAISQETVSWVCSQLREIERQIKDARALIERLKRAGEPTGDVEARLAEQEARYRRMLDAFPECR